MTALSDTDSRLVLKCRADEAAAFNEIVSRYKNRVYNYVSRMVGPGQDAEDLTQDTFVRAYLNLNSFQSRASLNTWLYRIATNICIDFRRKNMRIKANTTSLLREDTEDDGETEREFPGEKYDPARVFLNKELGSEVARAIADLPDKLRSVVVLHDIEGLPYEEIAAIVDCPLGTVKSRLFNARSALRRTLMPYIDGSLEPRRREREIL